MTIERPQSAFRRRAARAGRAVVFGACALAALPAGGCNILGPVATVISGPPKVEARYKLDPNRPTVIFIDDRASRVPQRALRLAKSREAETVLMEKKAVRPDSMIASQGAMQFAASERSGSPYSIEEIGRSVGAEVVIFVSMESWALSRDGATLSPAARAKVKVIDVKNGVRLFPTSDHQGYPMIAQMPVTTSSAPSTAGEINTVHAALAAFAGRELARLFFTSERDQFQGSFSDR